jgi:hypothetical protein
MAEKTKQPPSPKFLKKSIFLIFKGGGYFILFHISVKEMKLIVIFASHYKKSILMPTF